MTQKAAEKEKDPHFWKAFYFSFQFLIMYIPFMCVQNIISTV